MFSPWIISTGRAKRSVGLRQVCAPAQNLSIEESRAEADSVASSALTPPMSVPRAAQSIALPAMRRAPKNSLIVQKIHKVGA
ncbi:MAG: hypothetical protein CBC48_20410 [bacterium TMED88]|nr:hypothetical protein [Deltaproteobacteria bacterium]OUV21523.1 MAG: hypothetical protein CBC48_20410 [bacterium TMED88]